MTESRLTRRVFFTVLWALALMGNLAFLPGCETTRASSLQPAIDSYDAARYQAAYDQARES